MRIRRQLYWGPVAVFKAPYGKPMAPLWGPNSGCIGIPWGRNGSLVRRPFVEVVWGSVVGAACVIYVASLCATWTLYGRSVEALWGFYVGPFGFLWCVVEASCGLCRDSTGSLRLLCDFFTSLCGSFMEALLEVYVCSMDAIRVPCAGAMRCERERPCACLW